MNSYFLGIKWSQDWYFEILKIFTPVEEDEDIEIEIADVLYGLRLLGSKPKLKNFEVRN